MALDPPNYYHGSCGECIPAHPFRPDYESERSDWETVDDGFGTAEMFNIYIAGVALLYSQVRYTTDSTAAIHLIDVHNEKWFCLWRDGPYSLLRVDPIFGQRRVSIVISEKMRWARCIKIHGADVLTLKLETLLL